MSESQIHTVRKIRPGLGDSLHQQPEDNKSRLMFLNNNNEQFLHWWLSGRDGPVVCSHTYAATLIILGPKGSTCLRRASIVFPVPTMAYREKTTTHTGVNTETITRFASSRSVRGKRRSQTVPYCVTGGLLKIARLYQTTSLTWNIMKHKTNSLKLSMNQKQIPLDSSHISIIH